MSAGLREGRLRPVRVGLVQMRSDDDRAANLDRAEALCREACSRGAELVLLPENFAYLAREGLVVPCAEPLDGPIVRRFGALARECGADLLLGSVPEATADPSVHRNTSVLLGRDGRVLAVYRKVHLFDVDLPDLRLRESEAVEPGRRAVTADLAWGRLGLTICYDLRFPELYRVLRRRGAEVITVPAAFTAETGPHHWEVLLRARAIENQVFILAPAQWGEHGGQRASHGHSLVVDPWGRVLADRGEGEGILLADLDPGSLEEARSRIPSGDHARSWLLRGEAEEPS
jgi:predicted amidohydrolase